MLGPLWKQEAAHRCTGAVVGLCSTQIQFVPNKPTQGSTSRENVAAMREAPALPVIQDPTALVSIYAPAWPDRACLA